jgi:redox-sensing transcriptional repressor
VALHDPDLDRHGELVAGLPVLPLDTLEDSVRSHMVSIGGISTPVPDAQLGADRMAAGITSLLNLAPTTLAVPHGVDVRKVELSAELCVLAHHEQTRTAHARAPA